MGIQFNADEIFEMAEQIERNGARFYRKAAEGSAPAAQALFLRLAAMEDEHEKTFAALRAKLSEAEKSAPIFDPEGQAALYLQAVADGHIFDPRSDPAAKLKGKEKPAEILHIALGAERDSIAFYVGLREAVPPRLGRARIEAIIREEMTHVADLSRELAALG